MVERQIFIDRTISHGEPRQPPVDLLRHSDWHLPALRLQNRNGNESRVKEEGVVECWVRSTFLTRSKEAEPDIAPCSETG